jgi:hypothetical protein
LDPVNVVRRSIIAVAVVGSGLIVGAPPTTSATVPASAPDAEVCQPLCYGIADEDADDIRDAFAHGVRRFRKIIPFDIAMRMSKERTIPPNSERCDPATPGVPGSGSWSSFESRMQAWYDAVVDLQNTYNVKLDLLISFERDWCMSQQENRKVSNKDYINAVRRFRATFDKVDFTTFTAWNEPNHAKQGYRYTKNPGGRKDVRRARRAGGRFRALREYCSNPDPPRTPCEVVAGDFAEPKFNEASMAWLANYRAGAGLENSAAQVKWALHPYTSVDKRQGWRVRRFLENVPASELWFTEAGAFHHWRAKNRYPDPTDEYADQYGDLKFLLGPLAHKKFGREQPPIARLYYYEWTDDNKDFGTGLARLRSELTPDQRGHPFCLWQYRTLRAAERATKCDP